MKTNVVNLTMIFSILVLIATTGCKQSKYGWLGGKKKNDPKTSAPQELGPQEQVPAEVIPPPAGNPSTPAGFAISAAPATQEIGKDVSFSSTGCDTAEIAWSLGDGMAGSGATLNHIYRVRGNYNVEAVCSKADGTKVKASTSVAIIQGNCASGDCGNATQSASQSPGVRF